MSIVSFTFGIFLFVFGILYYIVPKKIQWGILLCGNLVFYAYSGPRNLIYILSCALFTWLSAIGIEKLNSMQKSKIAETGDKDGKAALRTLYGRRKKILVAVTLFLTLGVWIVLKYGPFLTDSFADVFHFPELKGMLKMDNAMVPANGRILYVTNEVKTILKEAEKISRNIDVTSNNHVIDRVVSRLDEVQVIGVPATLMKTAYNFTNGWKPAVGASQINMFLVHPIAVITPVSYAFASLDRPSAMSEGKWTYYEESFEDVFILNKRADALQFNVSAPVISG